MGQEPAGFGHYHNTQNEPCLDEVDRIRIKSELQENIALLKKENRLNLPVNSSIVSFDLPVRGAAGIDAFAVYGISNYVDHDNNSNSLLDYECGNRTYDSGSYDHQGVDFFGWPFGWYQMDNDQVEIVAAADGVIIDKLDGNNDRSCSFNGSQWNAVYVMHADSSIAWYGHLKRNSLTSKSIGENVFAGEFLGIMGSSGNSTGPHLHFEVYDSNDDLIDPYSGPCNSLNTQSWWQNQLAYYDSGLNQLILHDAPPVFPSCPNQEILNLKTTTLPGDMAYFAAYYRDHREGQVTNYKIVKPDGSTWQNWSHSPTAPFFAASYYYWSWTLPSNAEVGTWKFVAEFLGNSHEKTFIVSPLTGTGDQSETQAIPTTLELSQNYPNPFNPATQISYSLPSRSMVTLRVYNLMGQEIAELVNANQAPGNYSIDFYAGDLPSGSYLYRLDTETGSITNRMLLLK